MNTSPDKTAAVYQQAAFGNADAEAFLRAWNAYCHEIDDLIDGRPPTAGELLVTFAHAASIYSSAFFQQHAAELRTVVMLITDAYANSVAWQHAPENWKRQISDTLRFSGNEMIRAVAFICGGYTHLQSVSKLLWETSWTEHHNENQKPI